MRQKDKIESYILTLFKKYNVGDVVESVRSRYFKVNEKILRVSDHIGANSSGNTSIIVPSYNGTYAPYYVVHSHSNGTIVIMTYDEVKELVRTFVKISSVMCDFNVDTSNFNVAKEEIREYNKKLSDLYKENADLKKRISSSDIVSDNKLFGTDITSLTDKQIEALKKTVEQFNMHNKKK